MACPKRVEPAGRAPRAEGPGSFAILFFLFFGALEAPQEGAAVQGAEERRIWGTLSLSLYIYISATVPLGTEWACPQVLSLTPQSSLLNPEESF